MLFRSSGVLQNGVRLGVLRMPAVVAHEEVLDGDASSELVSADEQVVRRPNRNVLVGLAVDQLNGDPGREEPDGLDELTDREREVVALVAEGLSNEEIAGRLFVSPATAKTHVSRAMGKLGARDRAQVVVIGRASCRERV